MKDTSNYLGVKFDPPLRRCCDNPDVEFFINTYTRWGEIHCPVHGVQRRRGRRSSSVGRARPS